MITLQSLRSHS